MFSENYSLKDLTGQSFLDADDLTPGTVIRGSCFYQEGKPNCHIFPEDMTGVTFERCNLDNCFVPPGNTLADQAGIPCTNKQILVQNDLRDWIIEDEKPVEVMGKKYWEAQGVNIHCNDILKPLESIEQLYQIQDAIDSLGTPEGEVQ